MTSTPLPAKLELLPSFTPKPKAASSARHTARDSSASPAFTPTCAISKPSAVLRASLQRLVILSKLCAAMSALAHSQLPPTAWMNGAEIYSARFLSFTPPVGMNLMPPKGPESAFIALRPP